MFSKDEILALLQSGKSADDIAAMMAENLNVAQAKYAQLQQDEKIKQEAFAKSLVQVKDYCKTYYADMDWESIFANMTEKDFLNALKGVRAVQKVEEKVNKAAVKAQSIDDVLTEWLKSLGL